MKNMPLIVLDENERNVHVISDFIQNDQADYHFSEVQSLPFYTSTLKLSGKKSLTERF